MSQESGHCSTVEDLVGEDSGVTNGSVWSKGTDRESNGARGEYGGSITGTGIWLGDGKGYLGGSLSGLTL